MQPLRAPRRRLHSFLALSASLCAAGCAVDMDMGPAPTEDPSAGEEPDPAATIDDEDWWDEGPPLDDGYVEEGFEGFDDGADPEEETGTLTSPLPARPRFQLPFPCGQVWTGGTRWNHSPRRSIDFNRLGDLGDVVVAAAAGRVSRVANEGATSYGRWIEISHRNGYRTRYAHLRRQLVEVGQWVRRGQRIGRVGNTGGSTGPHLHYELRRYDSVLHPVFDGKRAYFWGMRNYESRNCR